VTAVGEIVAVSQPNDRRIVLRTPWVNDTLALGASVSCSGVCLTVVANERGTLTFDVSGETLAQSTAAKWAVGTRLNLERSLRVGDELGGHFVYGHVDGRATLHAITPEAGSVQWVVDVPASLGEFLAPKGSIALDGVSLTVNEVHGSRFTINLVPHTQANTTFRDRLVDDELNVEIDIVARYLRRQTSLAPATTLITAAGSAELAT